MCILKLGGGKRFLAAVFGLGTLVVASTLAASALPSQSNPNLPLNPVGDAPGQDRALMLRSVEVNGRVLSDISNESLHLPAHPAATVFTFGPSPLVSNVPLRFRCQLDGYEQGWHERSVEMRVVIRFIDANQRDIAEQAFAVRGESPG